MRLWTQARLMGSHAAASMAGADEAEVLNFSFELVRCGCCCCRAHARMHMCAHVHADMHLGCRTLRMGRMSILIGKAVPGG